MDITLNRMHHQFSYGVGNTHTNESNDQATTTHSTIPPTPDQMGSSIPLPSCVSPSQASTTTIPTPYQSSSSIFHPPNELSPNHLFVSPMASYQPPNYQQQQQLQQQRNLPQSTFPLHPMPLEQSTFPPHFSTAEPLNKAFLTHVNSLPSETISSAQDYLMASSIDVEGDVPQEWLWDAYQQAAMNSMILDRTLHREQSHLSQAHTPSHFLPHSTVAPPGLPPGDTFWHSNALELASRAAALASAPLMSYDSTAPAFAATAPAFAATISGSSASYNYMMESSSPSISVPSSSSQSSISAASGLLRPSRSDGVGRKGRRSSSKASSSVTSGGRSGRSRSLVSSPRPPFLSDPNETFGLDLSRTIPSYSLHSLQPYHSLHHCLAHNCQGSGHFSPSLSCSATSASPSPSISPQLSPISSFAHPSSRSPTVVSAKPESVINASTPPAPTFVRLPPPMFQCPMEKCPKSFARAYNLHIHLKTQHHLASKELAAVSPLRAPPSAPPVQIITPEEVAAGTTMSFKDKPSGVQTGTRATNTTTPSTRLNPPLTCADDNDNGSNNIDIDNNSKSNGGNGIMGGCCEGRSGDGGENGSLDCDSSCASSASGGGAAGGQGRSFACHLCPRIFSRKHDLHRHIRVHTGSKPYLCTNCHKAFARTDALCRHYKVEDDCRQVLMEVDTDDQQQ